MKAPENKNEVINLFAEGPSILEMALEGLSNNELNYTPRNGGWTIREIVHHLVDGDDIWKMFIKIALGNEDAEFNLQWYMDHSQVEWSKRWSYESRSIETSLALLKAIREHLLQLLEHVDDAWNKSAQFRNKDGSVQTIPVGFVIKMQTDHITHHVKRINEIREEMKG